MYPFPGRGATAPRARGKGTPGSSVIIGPVRRSLALVPLALLAACSAHAPARPAATAPAPEAAAPTPSPVATPPAAPPTPAPARADVLVARARALRAEGDVASARARLEAAFEAAPESDEVRLELADLLIVDGGDLDRAEALLAPVHAAGDGRLLLVLGRLADARGDDEGAVVAYGEALAVLDDPNARLRRALALERLDRRGEAIAELERLRPDRPSDPFVRGRLADLYEGTGRFHEAEAELRWLAELAPDRAAGWNRLARFYDRTGHPREAREAAARARATGGRQERALRPLLPSRS